jgi:protocatechuate 3,4-dioxygenase beta subunit
VDRRTLIKGLAALYPALGMRGAFAETPTGGAAKTCRLITQDIAGPYRIDDVPMRADITEGQPGTPLRLNFLVMDSFSCTPLPGAVVSIWHANAAGLYSGVKNIMLSADQQATDELVDMTGQTFLVSFETIYPGWYFPRPTHLHVLVTPPDYGEVATTQLYFPDEVCDQAYKGEHYAKRGPSPVRTDRSKDSPTDSSDAADLWLDLRREGAGYVADHNLGVTFYGGMFGDLPDFYRQS